MKDLITEAIQKKLGATLESVGGASALFGDPITFNGEDIVPVARIVIQLNADADGQGGGDAGLTGGIRNMAKGSGGGKAGAGIQVTLEPVGFVRQGQDGPEYRSLENNH